MALAAGQEARGRRRPLGAASAAALSACGEAWGFQLCAPQGLCAPKCRGPLQGLPGAPLRGATSVATVLCRAWEQRGSRPGLPLLLRVPEESASGVSGDRCWMVLVGLAEVMRFSPSIFA